MVDTDGELALMLDVPARALSLEPLQRVLAAVRSAATVWARCVADPVDNPIHESIHEATHEVITDPTKDATSPRAALDGRLQRV
jgi:hypothetical protein